MTAMTSRSMGASNCSGVPNSDTSAPAEKALSVPMSTIADTFGSASAARTDSTMSLRRAMPRLLTGGALSSTRATLSAFEDGWVIGSGVEMIWRFFSSSSSSLDSG
ncbi:hypothetical protein D9M69_656560 [compost metagenome]